MGGALSRIGPRLPVRRSVVYADDDEAELLDDVATAGGSGSGGFLVPTFRTPLPHTYGRDLGVAIRVADGARAPEFAHDLSVGATLHFFRLLDDRGAPLTSEHQAPSQFDTGVSFVLPAYLTAYIHGPLVKPKFLDPDDRSPVRLRPSCPRSADGDHHTCEDWLQFVPGRTVLAHIVFLPIVRPDFLLDDAEHDGAPSSSSASSPSAAAMPPGAVVPAAEIVIADG